MLYPISFVDYKYPISFVRQVAAGGQRDKMAYDMEVRTKQTCVIEFLHAEKLQLLTFIDAC